MTCAVAWDNHLLVVYEKIANIKMRQSALKILQGCVEQVAANNGHTGHSGQVGKAPLLKSLQFTTIEWYDLAGGINVMRVIPTGLDSKSSHVVVNINNQNIASHNLSINAKGHILAMDLKKNMSTKSFFSIRLCQV